MISASTFISIKNNLKKRKWVYCGSHVEKSNYIEIVLESAYLWIKAKLAKWTVWKIWSYNVKISIVKSKTYKFSQI